MKKITLLAFMLISMSVFAQENRNQSPQMQPPLKYGNDIIIENNAGMDQDRVKLAVAYNGWLYAAYLTVDSAANKGGITIMTSRDNGLTWSQIDAYSVADVRYTAMDLVVAGSDTSNMSLYVSAVRHNISGNEYIIFVDRYNATTLGFVGENLNINKGARPVYDIAMATDYRYPAVGSTSYSIGILYSVYSSSKDSVNYICSLDEGSTYTIFQNVASTGYYGRNVSIAYGRSNSASNGRYFGAWEILSSSSAKNAWIYTSRSSSTIDGSWIAPVNLDSLSSSMTGLCSNPSIAVQYNDTDNDSSSCTAIVLVQRDYNGDDSDNDLLGFYNKRAHYTNFWFRLDVLNSSENDMQPDITYDPGYNNFLCVYFDSTNKKLPYLVNNMNLTDPNVWGNITSQYNDSPELTSPWPRVEINPVMNNVAHVWIKDGVGNNGVAMFDAEYSEAGIQDNNVSIPDQNIYPNPASGLVNILWSSQNTGEKPVISITDLSGRIIESRIASNTKGAEWFETFDVSNLENGVYVIEIRAGRDHSAKKLIVNH
jgi:hypothetical protein